MRARVEGRLSQVSVTRHSAIPTVLNIRASSAHPGKNMLHYLFADDTLYHVIKWMFLNIPIIVTSPSGGSFQTRVRENSVPSPSGGGLGWGLFHKFFPSPYLCMIIPPPRVERGQKKRSIYGMVQYIDIFSPLCFCNKKNCHVTNQNIRFLVLVSFLRRHVLYR